MFEILWQQYTNTDWRVDHHWKFYP